MNSLLLLTIVFLSIYKSSIVESKIRCMTGYGQRGLLYSDATLWEHTCPLSDYCFEIYTTDLAVVQELIRFPWNSYYYEYYIRGCGGDFDTPVIWHPCRGQSRQCRFKGNIKVNITAPMLLTGEGGTAEFGLSWTCHNRDMCEDVAVSGAHSLSSSFFSQSIVSIASICIVTVFIAMIQ